VPLAPSASGCSALAALIFLSGCGQAIDGRSTGNVAASAHSESANSQKAGQAGPNRAQELIVEMTVADRNRMFQRFMRSGGERCARVTRSLYQGGTPAGEVFWDVACTDSGDWQVMIEPNATGSTRILECGVVATITPRARCWRRFDS
jgi:hypothetical protein